MALLSRKGKPHRHGCALLGAVLPDLPIFVLFGVETLILGHSQAEIWSERYFLPQWQNFIDPFNSIPLVFLGVGISYLLRSDRVRVVCWSMLLHCLADFFLHREDAHRHFFPLWDYKFKSPISYWEMDYHGGIVSAVEIVAMIGSSVYLFPRLQSYFAKGALVAVNAVVRAPLHCFHPLFWIVVGCASRTTLFQPSVIPSIIKLSTSLFIAKVFRRRQQ